MVPGLTTLLVTLDPAQTSAGALRAALETLRPGLEQATDTEHHVIDVRYDGEDLAEVAGLTGLSVAEVVAAHTGTPWRVAFCGFAPDSRTWSAGIHGCGCRAATRRASACLPAPWR